MSGSSRHDADEDVRLDALHSLQRVVSYQAGCKRCLSQISSEDRELLLLFYSQIRKCADIFLTSLFRV